MPVLRIGDIVTFDPAGDFALKNEIPDRKCVTKTFEKASKDGKKSVLRYQNIIELGTEAVEEPEFDDASVEPNVNLVLKITKMEHEDGLGITVQGIPMDKSTEANVTLMKYTDFTFVTDQINFMNADAQKTQPRRYVDDSSKQIFYHLCVANLKEVSFLL